MEKTTKPSEASNDRRSFLLKGLVVGAGAGTLGAGLLSVGLRNMSMSSAHAVGTDSSSLTNGDVAILRFLAAAEILETDLWVQYNELGGIQDKEVPGGKGNKPYTTALQVLDADMSQYIHDN